MGADFISVTVPIARPKHEALEKLLALSDTEIIDRMRYGVYDPDIFDEYYTFDDIGDPIGINRDVLMPVLIEALDMTYNVAEGRIRYGSGMTIGGALFATIGEMSWGDPPEGYDQLCVIYELGVTYDESKTLKWVDA